MGGFALKPLNRTACRLMLLIGLGCGWMHNGSGQPGSSRYAIWITLNPNDCLSCTGVLRGLLADPSVFHTPPRIVVPGRFSAAEAAAYRQLLLGEDSTGLCLEINDTLYNRLNGSNQSLIHLIDPQGQEVLRLALTNPLEIKRQIEHLRTRAGPYAIARSPCPAPVQLIGFSQLVVGGGQAALLNFARNAVLTLPLSHPCEGARIYDTSAVGFRPLYAAWHGDTSGWHRYQARHALMLRTVPIPAIRFEGLELLPGGVLRTQVAWYQPHKYRYEGQLVDRWAPEYVVVDFGASPPVLQALRSFPRRLYPTGLVLSTARRFRLSVEAETPTPKSPLWVDVSPSRNGYRYKPVRSIPALPQPLIDSAWAGELQSPYVVFRSTFQVIDSRTNTWIGLDQPPATSLSDSLRLLAVERTAAGWRGAVASPDQLHWAYWNASGHLIDWFGLGLPLAPIKSNYLVSGGVLYWMDGEQRLSWLAISP